MPSYEALTAKLIAHSEPNVVLTFDELDQIVSGLPASARKYQPWWTNSRSSQPHSRAWLDAGRRAKPDFTAECTTFRLDPTANIDAIEDETDAASDRIMENYIERTISLERDLEDQIVHHLEELELGLSLVDRQVITGVGRIDVLARSARGETVIIELKAGEAGDSAIGQIARYIGWYASKESRQPRAILIAGSFADPVKYAAAAIPALRLVTYRVKFTFNDAGCKG